jgi:hypothetical protein
MTSEWVKCMSYDGTTINHINFSLVTIVTPHATGSRVTFTGAGNDYAHLKETPDELFRMLNEVKNASRP